jgi:hypothetical protein
MNEQKEEPLEIKEEDDGSAVVNLPEPEAQLEPQEDSPVEAAATDDEDNDSDSESLRNAKRERRRAKRELVRKTSAEKDQRLQFLQKQNEDLLNRLMAVERKTQAIDAEKLERNEQDADLKLRYARQKVAEAGNAGDGDALARAEEMLYNARRDLEHIQTQKKVIQKTQQIPQIDPRVMKHVREWQNRTPWYEHEGTDLDSRIVKQVDEALTQEGWNPATEDYWDELDSRLQQYLPHRYNQRHNDGGRVRPRNMQASAGRESLNGSRQNFMLTPEQVRAMKDAGFWEDKTLREKMARRYYEESRKQANRS